MSSSDFTTQIHVTLISLNLLPKDKYMHFTGDYEISDHRWLFLAFFLNILIFYYLIFNIYKNMYSVYVIKQ